MRLDKFISDCSAFTRKDVRALVKRGVVTADGVVVKSPDTKVTEKTVVTADGAVLRYRQYVYLMLNKPQGFLSATEDAADPVVTDLVPDDLRHFQVFPVGRLDKDTEGLLLLSNDGQFDHAMTSPRKNLYKRYFARLDRPVEEADIALFRAGMEFREFTAKPALLELTENPCEAYVEIAEGKFHQVKRMFERAGKTVTFLKRTAIGPLKLDEKLSLGEMRELTESELALLLGR